MGADFFLDENSRKNIASVSMNPDLLNNIISLQGEKAQKSLDLFVLLVGHEYLHLAQRSSPKAGILNDPDKGGDGREILAHHFTLFPNTTTALDITDFEVGKTNIFIDFSSLGIGASAFYVSQTQSYVIRLNEDDQKLYETYIEDFNSLKKSLENEGFVFPKPVTDLKKQATNFMNANREKYDELRNE